jgi:hypothetical protein
MGGCSGVWQTHLFSKNRIAEKRSDCMLPAAYLSYPCAERTRDVYLLQAARSVLGPELVHQLSLHIDKDVFVQL